MTSSLWRIAVAALDAQAAEAAFVAFDGLLDTVDVFEAPAGAGWRVEGLSVKPPDRVALETRLAVALAAQDKSAPALAIERVPAIDWLARNQAAFPPLAVGRYFIHGAHYRDALPVARIGLLIDATTAFGTGEHATTRGCLMALDIAARRGRRRRVLDMGTGTGILAIAAAKTWRRPVQARDIDAEAVRVARHNAQRNCVAALVAVRTAPGYGDRMLRSAAPYDLVLANILARPLCLMARDLRRHLAPGGIVVLSGLLARHEQTVLAAHRRQGLHLLRRIAIEGWHTLVLARRPESSSQRNERP
jgi:ribosomal protein L11 methyltransferase